MTNKTLGPVCSLEIRSDLEVCPYRRITLVFTDATCQRNRDSTTTRRSSREEVSYTAHGRIYGVLPCSCIT